MGRNDRARKTMTLHATVNGRACEVEITANQTLLDLLRDTLGLTGTKRGCEIGECGACTVLLDGVAVNSCLVLAPQVEGRQITTVEGLAEGETLTLLQEALLDHDAVHCGFCTPGMLMSAKDLLDHTPSPTREEIRAGISGNLCRCTGYLQIIDAIDDAAKRIQQAKQ
jgi:aerobic-type carbon monoxide dehydrogenase small subunit (CoxS/CutS family)